MQKKVRQTRGYNFPRTRACLALAGVQRPGWGGGSISSQLVEVPPEFPISSQDRPQRPHSLETPFHSLGFWVKQCQTSRRCLNLPVATSLAAHLIRPSSPLYSTANCREQPLHARGPFQVHTLGLMSGSQSPEAIHSSCLRGACMEATEPGLP